jgi:hypothetical protein
MKFMVTWPFFIIALILTYEDMDTYGRSFWFTEFQLVWTGFAVIGESIAKAIFMIGSNLLNRDFEFIGAEIIIIQE